MANSVVNFSPGGTPVVTKRTTNTYQYNDRGDIVSSIEVIEEYSYPGQLYQYGQPVVTHG